MDLLIAADAPNIAKVWTPEITRPITEITVAAIANSLAVFFFTASTIAIAPMIVAGNAMNIASEPKHGTNEPSIPRIPKVSATTESTVTIATCSFFTDIVDSPFLVQKVKGDRL